MAVAVGAPLAAIADGLPVSSASVIVTDPTVLPPPGGSAGWVGHPCSHDLLFVPDWYVNGQHFNDVFARAHNAILSEIGTPTMTTVGNDVLSTFTATLHILATVVVGITVDNPMPIALPGTITARFIGKAGQSVTLTDTSTGSPSSWSWSFGDGATSAQRSPTHVWAIAGTYAVRLTVTNAQGSDSYGTLVTVTGSHGGRPVHRVLRPHGS